ncbi:unnamed protein product [Cyprideis torosa]|uniref:Uncharacterized protein n=1 Tax=Cyprideis torosa TaxID=163714 RepID=A0A7R8ZRP1_9CRUS|nr:unnamed protein product [Cyprideis torosa]CAG0894465.1 unnamed protein product [Cyprideis torosa]
MPKRFSGGCHCGNIRFELLGPETPRVLFCNCSICVKKQNHHFIIPIDQFRLVRGHTSMTTYTFGTNQAKHNFCPICGVESFYIPRSNPDGVAINIYCLDEGQLGNFERVDFDGINWEQTMASKAAEMKSYSKSKPGPKVRTF